MEKEIVVGLIASSGSLMVSIIALIGVLSTSRTNATIHRELETQRTALQKQLEAKKAAVASALAKRVILDKEFEASISSLKRGIQTIQKLKDEMQLILTSHSNSLPVSTLIERTSLCRDQLLQVYQECSAELRPDESQALHAAKSLAISLCTYLETVALIYVESGALSSEQSALFLNLRAQLSDAQQVLRDRRAERLEYRLFEINSDIY